MSWDDDFVCARVAHVVLSVEIHCAPSGWEKNQDEEGAGRWLRVNTGGIEEIIWRAA